MNNATTFRHNDHDLEIRIDGERFVILGDADLITDEEIEGLAAGRDVVGWTRVARSLDDVRALAAPALEDPRVHSVQVRTGWSALPLAWVDRAGNVTEKNPAE